MPAAAQATTRGKWRRSWRPAPGGRIVGIDPSETLIAESKTRVAGSGRPVESLIGDVRKLGAPAILSTAFVRIALDVCAGSSNGDLGYRPRLTPAGRVVASEIDHETHFPDSHYPAVSHPSPHFSHERERFIERSVFI
jgi:hypothetical protein